MSLTFAEKTRVLAHLIKWRLTWNRRNTHYRFTLPDNPKFMGPRDAVRLIKDGDVVANSGLGGNQRASIMYWAIQEIYKETGHPRGLTLMSIGGHGGRGKAPGTFDELGVEGLVTRFISGHMETFKAVLKLADAGKCEVQIIPQGTMALLWDALARGESEYCTTTGTGTFVDPRTGRGTPLMDPAHGQLVTVKDDMLCFTCPRPNVSFFNAPAADRKGNIYVKNCSMVGESYEMSVAAKKNGGKVIANVGLLVDEGYDDIFMPADMVDAVVVYPGTEQTGSISHRKHWPLFTTNSDLPIEKGIAMLKFANQTLGITPRRYEVENCLARLAAATFAENGQKGMYVNIGVGLPEEVCRLMFEGGLFEDITLLTESGVMGGLPAPGVFFGAGVNPKRIITSPQIFKMCYEKLDVTCLGVLQADSQGNVNVSNRGKGAINYVGPGGFIDLTTAARMVVFVGTWMAHAKMEIKDGKLNIAQPGTPKFVDKVDEVTFCGPEALKAGKKVFYCTNVGVFKLTERGMELIRVTPGVDIQKDIINGCTMKVVLPESGEVPLVGADIMTGQGYDLKKLFLA
jgi:propionate CoA-transferase